MTVCRNYPHLTPFITVLLLLQSSDRQSFSSLCSELYICNSEISHYYMYPKRESEEGTGRLKCGDGQTREQFELSSWTKSWDSLKMSEMEKLRQLNQREVIQSFCPRMKVSMQQRSGVIMLSPWLGFLINSTVVNKKWQRNHCISFRL